eukprot:364842_1
MSMDDEYNYSLSDEPITTKTRIKRKTIRDNDAEYDDIMQSDDRNIVKLIANGKNGKIFMEYETKISTLNPQIYALKNDRKTANEAKQMPSYAPKCHEKIIFNIETASEPPTSQNTTIYSLKNDREVIVYQLNQKDHLLINKHQIYHLKIW